MLSLARKLGRGTAAAVLRRETVASDGLGESLSARSIIRERALALRRRAQGAARAHRRFCHHACARGIARFG
jgi:hypothetical protein